MTVRLAAALFIVAPALILLPDVSAQPLGLTGPEEPIALPFGEANWEVGAMRQDPVKLVKISASKVRAQPREGSAEREEVRFVKFLLEFQRDLTVRDTDWTGVRPQPPFVFRFEDENGVTIASESGEYDSTPVGLQGRRVLIRLALKDAPVFHRVEVTDPRLGEPLALFIPELPVTARTKKVFVDPKPQRF
jgi:hypothetical protein